MSNRNGSGLRCCPMFRGLGFGTQLGQAVLIPGNQAIQIVTVRAIGAECGFVEQAFNTAPGANLVGMILEADGPAHLAVPAAAKDYYSRTRQPRGHHTPRPQPIRLLISRIHLPQPSKLL